MKRISLRAGGVAPSLTLEITAKGKKLKDEGVDVVSFGAGEPDFNTPDFIINKAKEGLDKGETRYTPASGTVALKQAVCSKLKVDNSLDYKPANIVVSNGAKHSLCNVCLAILDKGDEVIVPAPFWLTYPELIKLAEATPKYIDASAENNFKITPQQLEKAITNKTKAIIFNNPSNPTGAYYTESEIRELAKIIEKHDIYVISDDIYEKLIYTNDKYFSIAQVSDKLKENTIIVNGLSKSYAMTGWRIGYTASSVDVAKAMANMQSHMTSNPNSTSQYASVEALTSKESLEFLETMRATFDARRKKALELLDNMKPLTYVVPQGAFYIMVGIDALVGKTCNGTKIKSASDVANLLVEDAKVVTIPCESFGAGSYIRLSYAISEENIEKGLNRIKEFTQKVIKA